MRGEIKNSIGSGEAKEFVCTTHEHEVCVGGGMLEGELDSTERRERKGRK